MTKLFFPSLLFICLYSCEQNTSDNSSHLTDHKDSVAFVKKCVAFIKEVKAQEVADTNFILSDKPFLLNLLTACQIYWPT
jgi:hypothetical protein